MTLTQGGAGLRTIVLRDRLRSTILATEGAFVLAPPGLLVTQVGTTTFLDVDRSTLSGADICCGTVDVVVNVNGKPTIEALTLEPPAPVTMESLARLWDELLEETGRAPTSALGQQRGLPGRPKPSDHLRLAAIHRAHASCQEILAAWPQRHITAHVDRPIDLPGGRENLSRTALTGARRAAGIVLNSRVLPSHSVRMMSEYEDLDCPGLAAAALAVATLLRESSGLSPAEASWIADPFLRVSAKAAGASQSTPISSWPIAFVHAWESLQLVLSTFDASSNGDESSAPLTEVWRLYEGWVEICTKRTIGEQLQNVVESGHVELEGAGWGYTWTLGDGTVVGMLAQAVISSSSAFTESFLEGISSNSSDLRPDVVLYAAHPARRTRVAVFDAKYTAFDALTREAAATGGSKYLWGLEVGRAPAAHESEVGPAPAAYESGSRIRSVTLVSSRTTPKMHHASSRISGVTLPFYEEVPDEFRRMVSEVLVSLTT